MIGKSKWLAGAQVLCGATVAMAANDDPFDKNSQIGPNPPLPEPQQ